MNSYICKRGSGDFQIDVKLKFTKKDDNVFLHELKLNSNEKTPINPWDLKYLDSTIKLVGDQKLKINIHDTSSDYNYEYLFETEDNLDNFYEYFNKMKFYKEGVIYFEGTNKPRFTGSFIPSADNEYIESSGNGIEYYFPLDKKDRVGNKRYEGETYEGKYSGVGTFYSNDGNIEVEFYEIFEGGVDGGAEAQITFTPTNYTHNITLTESQILNPDNFDVIKFSLKYAPDLEEMIYKYLPLDDKIESLSNKIKKLENKNIDLEFKISDNYCKYRDIEENILITKYYGFGVMMIFQAIIYGVILLK